jgi:hypothetical protein
MCSTPVQCIIPGTVDVSKIRMAGFVLDLHIVATRTFGTLKI